MASHDNSPVPEVRTQSGDADEEGIKRPARPVNYAWRKLSKNGRRELNCHFPLSSRNAVGIYARATMQIMGIRRVNT